MTAYVPSRSSCPIGRASRIVGDRWALLILREAFLGVDRFDVFLERLPISRAILTSRLRLLVSSAVLSREPAQGKRAVYRLTAAGEDLRATMIALRHWGDRWLFAPDHQPVPQREHGGETIERIEERQAFGKAVNPTDKSA